MTRARDTSIYGSAGASGGGAGNVTLATLQPFLTTANVKESAGNLYYSNSRTFSNVQLASIDDLLDVNVKIAGNVIATAGQALVWNGSYWIPGSVTSNSNTILGSVTPYLTTSNVVELANLYFTNARARTAFIAADPTIEINWALGTIRANVTAIANAGSTTDAVVEGYNNKYYSNARVREYLSQSNLQIFGDVQFPNGDEAFISPGQTLVWSNTGTRLAWVSGSPSILSSEFANSAEIANVVRTIGNFVTANLVEFGNLYFTTDRVVANVANLSIDILKDVWTPTNLKISGYVLAWDGQNWMPAPSGGSGSVGSANTALIANYANVAGLANQSNTSYYANSAGISNLANTALYANVAGSTLYANVAGVANQANTSYYANVAGITNQANTSYYANVAGSTLYANVAGIANTANTALYANVAGVANSANVALLANAANTALYANVAGLVNSLSNFTTSNLAEGVNLYFTNTRVADTVQTAIYDKDITLNNLDVKGTLTVEGNTTLLYSTNNFITGKQIQLAYLAGSKAASEGAGLFIPGANASFLYGQTNDGFGLNKDLTILGNIIPAIGGRFSLGTQAKPFRDLFLGTQTLYVGNTLVGSSPSGGLSVTDAQGNPAPIVLSNVTATQFVTVDRLLGNVFPLTEINSYIGGNVAQFLSNTTGNLYLGVMKDGALNKFAGLRIIETRDTTGNVRSDLYFYNDSENNYNSTARLGILGTGNVTFNGNTVSINGTDIISNLGDFIGNAYYGSRPIDTRYGGTGGANTTVGRNNLFGDLPGTGGIVTKLKATNALSSFAIVESTGVSVAGGDGQSGNIVISIGQNVSTIASVTFKDLTLTGNLYVFGNAATVYSNTLVVSDPLFQVGYGNPSDNFDLGFIGHYKTDIERHAGFFRDHSDQTFKIFDNLTSEPGLNDIDTANATFRLANVAVNTVIGNVIGYVSTLNNHTTAALREGSNNLYYTNSRVLSAVTPLLTTANVIELSNQYYTNARVNTAVRPMLTTANVIETSGNLYFTNARVLAVLSALTTANITEVASNLYFTNARVIAALSEANIQGNLRITNTLFANAININGNEIFTTEQGANLFVTRVTADVITGNTWNRLYTANVIETSGNLYFTNARVLAALSEANIAGNLRITNSLYANSIVINGNEIFTTEQGANLFVTRVTADVVTANSYVSTGTGVPTLSSATNINLSANGAVVIQSSPLRLKTYTLPAANVLSASAGDIVYISNTNSVSSFDGTTWLQIGEKLINVRVTDTVYATNVIATGKLQANTLVIAGLDVTNNVLANTVSASSFSGNTLTVDSITSNIWNRLYTANVIEFGNLYYTDARVLSNVSAMSINVLADVDITGIQNNGILIWDGTKFAAGSVSASATSNTALFAYLAAFANTAGVANVSYLSNVANSVLTISNFTTANLAEGINLYYTNARVVSAVTPLLTTANVIETTNNLYYTNARVNVFIQQFFTTANIRELGNLYFTNARVLAAIYGADLTLGNLVSTTETTGTFVANTITANTLTITGNATIGSGAGGTLSGLSYLYSTNVIANAIYVSNIVLQNTDVTQQILGIGLSNVIYSVSAEQSNVNYSANIKLTGTNAITGNVSIQDQVSFKGTGLVRVSRQDADTIVINAGVAPVVATPVANTATEVTRFSTSLYRTAEFIYTSNTSSYTNSSYANLYNAGKILLLHSGTEVIFTQYAILQTGNGLELASFSATINSGNVILYATAADGVTATIKLSGTTYTEI